jgi:general stress protein 26
VSDKQDEAWRGKVGRLSEEEKNAFLGEGQLGRLAVLDDDGWPYVVPVWYEYSDGGYYIIPRARSRWAQYMKRDNRVSLCIDDPAMRKVMVKGEIEIVEEPNVGGRWVEIGKRMSVRYLGEHGPDYLEPTINEPRWLVFLRPIETTTWQGVDWAMKYKHSNW